MANWPRSLSDAFWTLDRLLGGQRRPTRIQKWIARHPIGTGLCMAVPYALFFIWLSSPEPENLWKAALGGLAMGFVFVPFVLLERLRQRRLVRLGIWDGS